MSRAESFFRAVAAALAASLWEAAEDAERAFSDWCFSAQFVILRRGSRAVRSLHALSHL